MGFLDKLFLKKQIDSRLVGNWSADSSEFHNTQVTFTSNGKLIYKITENGKVSIMNMTFETSGNLIISNQPSHPRIEKTKYNITGDLLTLDYDGVISKYMKIK
jgi:hypothetical protein